jgi:hypothetical protein
MNSPVPSVLQSTVPPGGTFEALQKRLVTALFAGVKSMPSSDVAVPQSPEPYLLSSCCYDKSGCAV